MHVNKYRNFIENEKLHKLTIFFFFYSISTHFLSLSISDVLSFSPDTRYLTLQRCSPTTVTSYVTDKEEFIGRLMASLIQNSCSNGFTN